MTMLEIIVSLTLIIGGLFALIGSIGMLKLPDFLSRLHAPAKITTLGIGSLLMSSMIFSFSDHQDWNVSALVILIFIFMTTPISAHLLSKSAIHLNLPVVPSTKNQHWLLRKK
ncbi:Na+/H+ antiporter subunit G [bacterium]|nr:Na+/H+ antiporter subunit G [bacterium]